MHWRRRRALWAVELAHLWPFLSACCPASSPALQVFVGAFFVLELSLAAVTAACEERFQEHAADLDRKTRILRAFDDTVREKEQEAQRRSELQTVPAFASPMDGRRSVFGPIITAGAPGASPMLMLMKSPRAMTVPMSRTDSAGGFAAGTRQGGPAPALPADAAMPDAGIATAAPEAGAGALPSPGPASLRTRGAGHRYAGPPSPVMAAAVNPLAGPSEVPAASLATEAPGGPTAAATTEHHRAVDRGTSSATVASRFGSSKVSMLRQMSLTELIGEEAANALARQNNATVEEVTAIIAGATEFRQRLLSGRDPSASAWFWERLAFPTHLLDDVKHVSLMASSIVDWLRGLPRAPDSLFRPVRRVVEHPLFMLFSYVLIVVHAALLGCEGESTAPATRRGLHAALDAVAFLQLVEVVAKFIAWGPEYLCDKHDFMDVVIVVASAADAAVDAYLLATGHFDGTGESGHVQWLRLIAVCRCCLTHTNACIPRAGEPRATQAIRALRLLRLLTATPSLRMVVEYLTKAWTKALTSLLVLLIYLLAVGAIGMQLFGREEDYQEALASGAVEELPRFRFTSFWHSVLATYIVSDGENSDGACPHCAWSPARARQVRHAACSPPL